MDSFIPRQPRERQANADPSFELPSPDDEDLQGDAQKYDEFAVLLDSDGPGDEDQSGAPEAALKANDIDRLSPESTDGVTNSVTESAMAFKDWAAQKLLELAANVIHPGLGAVIEKFCQLKEVVTSVVALDSEDPVVTVPLFAGEGLDLNLEVPLEEGGPDHVVFFVAPDSPSLIGGWSVEKAESSSDTPSGRANSHADEADEKARQRARRPESEEPEPEISLYDVTDDELILLYPRRRSLLRGTAIPASSQVQLYVYFDPERMAGLWVWTCTVRHVRLTIDARTGRPALSRS